MLTTRRLAAAAVAVSLPLALSACGGGDSNQATAQSGPMSSSMPGMNMSGGSMAGMNMSAFQGDGLRKTVGGYTLAKLTSPRTVGKQGQITFVIDGPTGKPQVDFTMQQTKLLHMYVVRDDLTEFQHIHPTLDTKTGKWTVPVTFAKPGPYRLVVEFEALKDDGNFDDRILGTKFTVTGGKYAPVHYTMVSGSNNVDGYSVTMDPTAKVHGPDLHLKITKAGQDVTDLQQYLQSYAHITGFREGDLKAVHMHPNEVPPYKTDPNAVGGPNLTLASLFTEPGKYRMFVEFQTDGVLHQVPMDIDVS